MPMTPACQSLCPRTIVLLESTPPWASTMARASSTMRRSTSWRRALQESSSWAISVARAGGQEFVSISTARRARSKRPAALILGGEAEPDGGS